MTGVNTLIVKILIDLDGVLNEYGKEPYNENYIPEIKDGAKEFVRELSEFAELYLFTSRNLMLSTKWLIENNFYPNSSLKTMFSSSSFMFPYWVLYLVEVVINSFFLALVTAT